MPLLIGIDLGTTGCKAVVYDAEGRALGESNLEYGLIMISATMIEQDPLAWWQLTCRAIDEALKAAGADRRAVRGLAVSSQGISFLLVDEAGRPLCNAISWLDQRAHTEAAAVVERIGAARIFEITGKPGAAWYVLPKLMWLRTHRPDIWAAARGVLMGQDYLVHRLCGAGHRSFHGRWHSAP